jgi:hypothetical protein
MKTTNAPPDEFLPRVIENPNYLVFKSPDLDMISNSSAQSLLLEDSEIEEEWGWLYSKFSNNRLRWIRSLYTISYGFEGFCFVFNVFYSDIRDPPHTKTPFTVDPYFKIASWSLALALGFPFIKVIYTNTISALNLICWSIKLRFLPVYYLLSILFINRSVQNYPYNLIFELIVIFLAMVFCSVLYLRIKYKDDGRYRVTLPELLGIQVHFSVLSACLLVELCETIFETFGKYDDFDRNTSTIFNWENENWTILVMVLTCWTGCLILYLYKDVFYPLVLSFTYFGIYSVQMRIFCPDDKGGCSESVTRAAISLGSILLFFIVITIITYPKLVFYTVRRTRG